MPRDLQTLHRPAPADLMLTQHALVRMNARRISREAVLAAIIYGRVVYTRGARFFVLGRREVRRYAGDLCDIRRCEGLQVVCKDNHVVTVFRDHDFSQLRKCKPRRPNLKHWMS